MYKKIFEKVKKYMLSPTKTFKAEKKTKLEDAFKYGLIGLAIYSLLNGLIFMAMPSATLPLAGVAAFIAIFVFLVIFGFIAMLIGSLWLHLWAYIFGARKGLKQTIKSIFYANTPNYYLGWIPFINILSGIWSLVLQVIGLVHLQKLSTMRAIGAVFIAIIIPLIILVAIVAMFFIAGVSTLEATPTGMFGVF